MTPESSTNEQFEEMKAMLEAKGVYEEGSSWEIPVLWKGSVFDVPMTPERLARVERLKAKAAELRKGRLQMESKSSHARKAERKQEKGMEEERIARKQDEVKKIVLVQLRGETAVQDAALS